jgi:DNA-binding transcriptional regulator YiaG
VLLPPVITLNLPISTTTIEHQLIQGRTETYSLETILSRSVHAIAQTVSLEAAYLALLFAAYATDADTPWEIPCFLTGTTLMEQLGWSQAKTLTVERLHQLQNIVTVLNNWFVVISDIDPSSQRYQMIRVPLWSFGDLNIQGILPKPTSNSDPISTVSALEPYELKLQVSPGSWISLFPQGKTTSTLETLRQYGDLAKSILQISMTQYPFAARLGILLTATSGFNYSGQYQVEQLLTHLIANPIQTFQSSPERCLDAIADWDQALCILRQLGWEVEFDTESYPEALRPAWSLPYSSFSTTAQRSDRWVQDWLNAKVTIRPTRLIQQQVMMKGDRYSSEPISSDSERDRQTNESEGLAFIPGDILEKALLAKGISQSKFAEQLNLDRSMVNRWIKGSRVIQPKHQVQIWQLLGNELQPLMEGSSNSDAPKF